MALPYYLSSCHLEKELEASAERISSPGKNDLLSAALAYSEIVLVRQHSALLRQILIV